MMLKLSLKQAVVDLGICTVDNFSKVLAEMIKHVFPANAFHEQNTYLRRHLAN